MDIEGVLLTGGRSKRMGADKARLLVDGEALAERVARRLAEVCQPVTVIGREALPGFPFMSDAEEFLGPLAALARFEPRSPFVFAASCDIVRFDPVAVRFLAFLIGERDAAIPSTDGILQPLCALYRARALTSARAAVEGGETRLMRWASALDHVAVPAEAFAEAGLDPRCVRGANTPDELAELLSD